MEPPRGASPSAHVEHETCRQIGLPVDVLERFLWCLALDGAAATWQRLAFLVSRNGELMKRARQMHQPLVLHVGFETPDALKFIIPFQSASYVHIEIDWGDSTPFQRIDEVGEGLVEHCYDVPGSYCVRVFPKGEGTVISDSSGLSNEPRKSWLDHLGWKDQASWKPFWCSPIRSFEAWGTLGLRSLSRLFAEESDFNVPLPPLAADTVVDMSQLFSSARSFNQPLNHWKVGNVTNMNGVFLDANSFNQPLDSWNVGNVTTMMAMFKDAYAFNQPIQSWDVSKVTAMDYMFAEAQNFNQPIGDWQIHDDASLSLMFDGAWMFGQPIVNHNFKRKFAEHHARI